MLGADDISGILEILYCVQLVLDSGKPHKKIEILFTIGEEFPAAASFVEKRRKTEDVAWNWQVCLFKRGTGLRG